MARRHYLVDSGVSRIFRVLAASEVEADPKEPVKILEKPAIYDLPAWRCSCRIYFRAYPQGGFHYPHSIVQIAPEDLPQIGNELPLPDGWRLGPEFPRPAAEANGHP